VANSISRPVLQIGTAEIQHLADGTFVDILFRQRDGRGAAVVEGHHVLDTCRLNRVEHGLDSFGTTRQRLLADNVLTSPGRGNRNLGMRVIRRHDIDNIDLRVVDNVTPVSRIALEAQTQCSVLSGLFGHVGDHLTYRDCWRRPEKHRHRCIRHRMGFSHKTGADHTYIQCFHYSVNPLVRALLSVSLGDILNH
jgi:hypothetical protein